MTGITLLNRQDRNPVLKTLPDAAGSPFVLVGDHAGAAIPSALGDLGVSAADRARHIAVDIGTEALGRALSARLDAPYVSQRYSRLVVDCNRDPAHPGWIVETSDGTAVPGNAGLTEHQRGARRSEIFEPYHRAIGELLDARAGGDPVLVSLHSFTPELNGSARPWEIGVLYDGRRDEFALNVLAGLGVRGDVIVGDNEPYRMDATDYTVPRHAYPRGLRYVEIEVRQDMLGDGRGIASSADLLGAALKAALEP